MVAGRDGGVEGVGRGLHAGLALLGMRPQLVVLREDDPGVLKSSPHASRDFDTFEEEPSPE